MKMKQRKLTAEERRAYLARRGTGCPFRDCTGTSTDMLFVGQKGKQKFVYRCTRCKRAYTEVMDAMNDKLVGVVAED